MMQELYHTPVLLKEVLDLLYIKKGGIYLDCTLGGGGHFRKAAEMLDQEAVLIGIDRDPNAIAWNREHSQGLRPKVLLAQSIFSEFGTVLESNSINAVDGMLLDLGVSSHQIDVAERGFSFMQESDLDMRMNPGSGKTARELLHELDSAELAHILSSYGDVQNASRMADAIKQWISEHPLESSGDLKDCLCQEYGHELQYKVLAKIFQALRIAVNDELGELERFLEKSVNYLKPAGRLAVIAYHSLEDRIVKNFIRSMEGHCTCPPNVPICTCKSIALLKRVTKKAVKANDQELLLNPRSRSARMRVAEKI